MKNNTGLSTSYNYYASIKEKLDKIYIKYFESDDEINKSRLYELVVNICNQVVFDYVYSFTSYDMFFIAEYNIDIFEIVNLFIEDIQMMKNEVNG